MSTSPGDDAMTVRFHGDTDAARLKRQRLPRPLAWRIRPSEVARLTADGQHCETRKCHKIVDVVTWRWWRSLAAGRVLVSEHVVCERHGAEFAVRHHIGIDPPGSVSARHLSDAEMAAAENEGGCDWFGCGAGVAWIFTTSYTTRGVPQSDRDLSCDRHVGAFADRFHIADPREGAAR
jgi:hypothetical protein